MSSDSEKRSRIPLPDELREEEGIPEALQAFQDALRNPRVQELIRLRDAAQELDQQIGQDQYELVSVARQQRSLEIAFVMLWNNVEPQDIESYTGIHIRPEAGRGQVPYGVKEQPKKEAPGPGKD